MILRSLIAGAIALAFITDAEARRSLPPVVKCDERGCATARVAPTRPVVRRSIKRDPQPVACQITGAGGSWVVDGPCLRRLDRLRQRNAEVLRKMRRRHPVPSAPPVETVGSLLAGLSAALEDISHTAIYVIAQHTVFMPNGSKLEAHSGRGAGHDNPRMAWARNRGPAPPNVYELAMRERPFHGVRAIRLQPLDEAKMHGRDGILAHTYMGMGGQSHGCVVFKNYRAFLAAFDRGEVRRMVVVARLNGPQDGHSMP